MKRMRRITACILTVVSITVFSFANITFAQETEPVQRAETQEEQYMDSGRKSVAKLSMDELKQLYGSVGTYEKLYKTEPVLTGSDYRPSVLSDEAYDTAEAYINYYRTAAGLGKITLKSKLNESAGYGALVLAMNDSLTHYPPQPENMTDEDYQEARWATTSSNLSAAYGYSENNVLQRAIAGQIADKSTGNMKTLGHRRWLLNPEAKTFGIGCATNDASAYTDVRVFGHDTEWDTPDDYDFIAWPASGANLSDTFSVDTPWSVTLNPSLYYYPSSVSVEVQSLRYGTTWVFDDTMGRDTSSDQNYFHADLSDYGIDNCIIFRPAYKDLYTFKGDYIVTVKNVRSKTTGEYTDIRYKVTFDDYEGQTSLGDCDISLSQNTYMYDGTSKEPEVTVKDRFTGSELVKDKDYTVEYYQNTEAGIGVVYVNGINQYTGTQKLYFEIEPRQPQFSATLWDSDIDIGDSTSIMVVTEAKSWVFTSDNPSVAEVSQIGKISGISEGTANITVRITDPNYQPLEQTFCVTVRQHIYNQEWLKGEDGGFYWYENGEKQGVRYLDDGSEDTSYRGKEIYDPRSDAWYWLDGAEGGRRAESKDVYQESQSGIWGDCKVYTENGDIDLEKTTGKWVRYDASGHMIKGWDSQGGQRFYFDPVYGTMAKGYAVIDGIEYHFDENTGVYDTDKVCYLGEDYTGWQTIDGGEYWFEHSIRQGYSTDSNYRGKEIYDPESDAWYWLDNIDGGKKAVNKDVYQESTADDAGNIGKWVRYDAEGHMVKGWQTTDSGTYYFDPVYGTMYKGVHEIGGVTYTFDENTGILR